MKRIILIIICVVSFVPLHAQTDTSSYAYANGLYEAGKYPRAIPIYENLIAKNGPSAEIYYNLGNACYKANLIGKSILNYEKSLKLNPVDEDTKYNLSIANLRIRDKLEPVDELFLLKWWRDFFQILGSTLWAITAIALIWIAMAGFALFRMAKNISARKAGFYTFLPALCLFILALAAGFSRASYDKKYQYAIIMEPSSIIKSEPNESSTNLLILHEGLKLRVLDQEGDWSEVKLADGNIGWLMTSSIAEI